MRRILAIVLSLSFVASTAAAQTDASPEQAPAAEPDAEERERARELFDNGATLYEEGQYDAAIVAWEESYRLSGEALLLYNIANAYERLGDLEASIDYLNQYRAFAPADERDTLVRRIRTLEGRVAAQQESAEASEPELTPAALPSRRRSVGRIVDAELLATH